MSLLEAIPQNNPSTIEEWADGSFAAPSAKFKAEPTTGFYRNAAGEIGFRQTLFSTRAAFGANTSHDVLKIQTGSGPDVFATIAASTDGSNNQQLFIGMPASVALRFNSTLIDASGTMRFRENKDMGFGQAFTTASPPLAAFRWNTAATNDVIALGLADANMALEVVKFVNRGDDYAAAVSINPRLRGFSANAAASATDEHWSIHHDVTNTVFETGSGLFDFSGADLSVDATKKIFFDGPSGNTSIHEESATEMRLTVGGVVAMQLGTGALNTNLPFRGAAGVVGAPGLSFGGDTDTGRFSVAADRMADTVGGAKIFEMFNDSATLKMGFFGLGTPIAKPTVSGSRANAEQALANLLTAVANLGLITDSTGV